MLWNLGAEWLVIALVVVGILSFILGYAVHATMGEDAFGASGNALIMTAGFFLAILAANGLGYNLRDVRDAMSVGLGGAFACLFVFSATKLLLGRF